MTLQEMRETWRPKLAHDLRRQNWAVLPMAFAVVAYQPEAGATVAALVVAFYGLLMGLFGIRGWEKRNQTNA